MKINFARYAWISLSALTLARCGGVEPVDTEIDPPTDNMDALEFEALVDPRAGTVEFTKFGTSLRGLDPAPVVQDGVAGSGPANTVELVTTGAATDVDGSGACGFASSFCANVTLRSFYSGPLNNAFVQITSITPAAGHTGLNSDAPQMGLSAALGLWGYNTVNGGGGSGVRQWVFGDDGTAFRIGGRVMADLCANGVQDGTETGVDCGGTCGGTCTTVNFRLQRTQEFPSTNANARGQCTATLSGTQTRLILSCTHDVAMPTAAHIHNGLAGTNGPVLFDLGTGTSPINANITVTPAQATAMLNGNYYVNVHNAAFPNGAIRGQIATTAVAFALIPGQENPPTAATTSGSCIVSLSPNQTQLRAGCTHNVTATAAHIHRGAPRVNGPIVFTFTSPASPIGQTFTPTAQDITDFLTGNFYVNVHSAANPGGEIRGQIATSVDTAPSGAQETPPNGSTAGAVCRSFLSPNELSLDSRCTHNVVGATAAHIHRGAAGVAGPVIFNYGPATSPIQGNFTFSAADANDFFNRNFYINIHSGTFPGGEVRGQITP